mmetsp:Transcript_162649/g.395151  ORF Transcript_162649/g.395151 Transcript_162649/m.395151 type:complete len:331 (+) Transcript_162649:176-1168(+)
MPDVERFSEPLKFLPIAYIAFTTAGLWTIYVVLHCLPRMQIGVDPALVDQGWRFRSQIEFGIFNFLFILFLMCYAKSILTHPGEVPNNKQWEYTYESDKMPHSVREKKKSGDRRHCKWCGKYKPDRCHHCRVCKTCILKMDHHCPWIYNCVGFRNHKYFFLLLVYAAIDCNLITWTMLESVKNSVDTTTPFMTMFLVLFGETLAAFLGILVTVFLGFHIWLMMKGMTTIEFCEKSMKKAGYNVSAYDRGPIGNIQAVVGDNPIFWLLPYSPPSGDGLYFLNEMETSRGIRKKMHHNASYGTSRRHSSGKSRRKGGAGTNSPGEAALLSQC